MRHIARAEHRVACLESNELPTYLHKIFALEHVKELILAEVQVSWRAAMLFVRLLQNEECAASVGSENFVRGCTDPDGPLMTFAIPSRWDHGSFGKPGCRRLLRESP